MQLQSMSICNINIVLSGVFGGAFRVFPYVRYVRLIITYVRFILLLSVVQ